MGQDMDQDGNQDMDQGGNRDGPAVRLLLIWRVLFWFCTAAGLLMAGFLFLELTSPDRALPGALFVPAVVLLLIWAGLTRYIGRQIVRLRQG